MAWSILLLDSGQGAKEEAFRGDLVSLQDFERTEVVDDLKGFAVFDARSFFTTFEDSLEKRFRCLEAALLHIDNCEAIFYAQRGDKPGVEGAIVAGMDTFELRTRGVKFMVLGPVENAEADSEGVAEVVVGVFGWECLFQVDKNLRIEVFGFDEVASVAVHVC